MLVIGSNDYVWISIHCIVSFLKFNPGSKINVSLDKNTYNLGKWVYRFIDYKRITTERVEFNDFPPLWNKAKLILELQNSNKIFMDADLRWNSTLPVFNRNEIVLFSVEYEVLPESPLYKVFNEINWKMDAKVFMFNTSFFYWNNNDLKLDFDKFKNYLQEFESIEDFSIYGFDKNAKIKRLSEQISLSYALKNNKVTGLDSLLSKYSLAGAESTYFGATGHKFGR
jgi:hypothetical protein